MLFSHSTKLRAIPLPVVNAGADPEGGDLPLKTYESNGIHQDFCNSENSIRDIRSFCLL